jgi:hypothetical protein
MIGRLRAELHAPSPEYRCDVRWWLAEGLHTDATLRHEIATLAESGFGAAEFLAMDEVGADSTRYGWGSEEWVHDTLVVTQAATEAGLGVSFTSGTNWSNANLPDSVHGPDSRSAAKELDYTVVELEGGERFAGTLPKPQLHKKTITDQLLLAVVAAPVLGESRCLPELGESVVLPTCEQQDWTAPEGDWLVFAFWLHGTGQEAGPSVGTSFTINYLDRYGVDALVDYWDSTVLTDELKAAIAANGRVQLYMDSLELTVFGAGGQLWGYHLLDEFRSRRGYDLVPYLPLVIRSDSGMMSMGPMHYRYESTSAPVEQIRNDLTETLTSLYIDNTLRPLQEWLHGHGMTLRAEISYGLPFEISQPGKFVDGIETESLEFAGQLDSYRALAGAAHLYGKTYSSETGATVENYQLGLNFYTQLIFTQFAAGVTKTVLHGWSSLRGAPESTDWPGHEGMWPMFSERFGPRQPAWPHYQDWTTMLARYQWLLRAGHARRDVGILRSDYKINNMFTFGFDGLESDFYSRGGFRAGDNPYWKDGGLQRAGYTFDYFSPRLLEDREINVADGRLAPETAGYQALVVFQEAVPADSMARLVSLAEAGLPVVLVNNCAEDVHNGQSVVHGRAASRSLFNDGRDLEVQEFAAKLVALPSVRVLEHQDELPGALAELGIAPVAASDSDQVLTLTREVDGNLHVFVYHYQYDTGSPVETTLMLEGVGRPYQVDCWTGGIEPVTATAEADTTRLQLQLRPGQATVIVLDRSDTPRSEGKRTLETLLILGDWELEVESWTKGDKVCVTEDRGLGYVSEEVYYETVKTVVPVGVTELKPWSAITEVGPEVSGVGRYRTVFSVPTIQDGCRFELTVASTYGNAATVRLNGQPIPFDFSCGRAELTDAVRQGENILEIDVASTLTNVLLASGYFEKVSEQSKLMAQLAMGEADADAEAPLFNVPVPEQPQDYGLQGPVTIRISRNAA